eukprot:TRINITY_DN9042_c0_g1_i1.p1 TRINITY_DN9042_c0_g1~~TRINITY_DN9042_c0_g1_i1.p1  ORF type:complete len:191 (-),score=26.91 TRINITY_DN9042_c0_g1_i1:315-887(-)
MDHEARFCERAVFVALELKNLPMLKYLIQHGASTRSEFDGESDQVCSLILSACRSGNVDQLRYLVEEAQLNLDDLAAYSDMASGNPLFHCHHPDCLRVLLKHFPDKIDFNEKDLDMGATPIQQCLRFGAIDKLEILLQYGARLTNPKHILRLHELRWRKRRRALWVRAMAPDSIVARLPCDLFQKVVKLI